jgi:hypothetical protein
VADTRIHGTTGAQRTTVFLHRTVADKAVDVLPQLALFDLDELHGIAPNVSYTTHVSPLGYGLS